MHTKKLEKLIDQADQALYESKEKSRNTFTFYQLKREGKKGIPIK